VRLEASTKPPIHNLIHEFLINMAFTMACPNFKKGLKMAFGPLEVNMPLFLVYIDTTIRLLIVFRYSWNYF
jgi:hypothetical protein